MKRFSIPLILAFILFLGNTGCDPDDVCKASYLADLTLNAFKSTLTQGNSGQEIYSIAHSVINFIEDIVDCSQNAETAAPSQFLERILYADNPDFNNAVVADETQFHLNELHPGATGTINDQLSFLQNGYYLFHSIADYTQQISERNESNNEDDNPLQRSSSSSNIGSQIIHITNASPVPVYDSTGNRVFIKHFSSSIKYE